MRALSFSCKLNKFQSEKVLLQLYLSNNNFWFQVLELDFGV